MLILKIYLWTTTAFPKKRYMEGCARMSDWLCSVLLLSTIRTTEPVIRTRQVKGKRQRSYITYTNSTIDWWVILASFKVVHDTTKSRWKWFNCLRSQRLQLSANNYSVATAFLATLVKYTRLLYYNVFRVCPSVIFIIWIFGSLNTKGPKLT